MLRRLGAEINRRASDRVQEACTASLLTERCACEGACFTQLRGAAVQFLDYRWARPGESVLICIAGRGFRYPFFSPYCFPIHAVDLL